MWTCLNESRKNHSCWGNGTFVWVRVESDKGYEYLGILVASDIIHNEMKDKIQNEYYRRVRKLTLSKLNGGNTIRAIDRLAVLLVRYSAGVLKWTKDELKVMEGRHEILWPWIECTTYRVALTDCTSEKWNVEEDLQVLETVQKLKKKVSSFI